MEYKNKEKITVKALKKAYKLYCLSYCRMPNFFGKLFPDFYTCGVYGWNSDVYIFGNYAISTGYRPAGENLETGSLEKSFYLSDIDAKAKNIFSSDLSWEKKEKAFSLLVSKFSNFLANA